MTTPTLPRLTRALVAGLLAGNTADALVEHHLFGAHIEFHQGIFQCVGPLDSMPGTPNILRDGLGGLWPRQFSTDLNAAARMEQRFQELGKHKLYIRSLLWTMGFFFFDKDYDGNYCLSQESHFELATAPALLRVKAALLLFCEE